MPDPKLKIQIETTATGSGAADAARAIDKLTESHKKASSGAAEATTESSALGDSLLDLGRKTSPAREGVESLDQVLRGGASGFFGLAKAGKAVFEIFQNASPFGVFITAASLLVGLGLSLKEKFFAPAEEGLKKTEEASAKAAEGLTKLGATQLHFDQKKKEAEELAASFDKVRASAEAEYQNIQKLADADLAFALAQINLKEKQDTLAAGGNEDRKKEIAARAEADRINATDQANVRKSNAEVQAATAKAQTAAVQSAEQAKIAADQKESAEKFKTTRSQLISVANSTGVKSDQQSELDELARLKEEQSKSEKKKAQFTEDLRFLQSSGLDPTGGSGARDILALREIEKEQQSRSLRISQLQPNAEANQRAITSGKETYKDQATELADAAKKALELANANPSDENKNLAGAAAAKARTAEELVKFNSETLKTLEDGAKAAGDSAEKLARDFAAARTELLVAQTRAATQGIQTQADRTGVAIQVSDINQDRGKRREAASSSNAVNQAGADAITEKQRNVFSTSTEGQALEAQKQAKLSQIVQDSTPGDFSIKGLDSNIRGTPTAGTYQTFAPGDSSGPLDKGVATLQSATASVPAVLSPDHFNDAVAKLAASTVGFSVSALAAIEGIKQGLDAAAQQQAALKQQMENLANTVANQRQ